MAMRIHPTTPTASVVPAFFAALLTATVSLALSAYVALTLAPATGWSALADQPFSADIEHLAWIWHGGSLEFVLDTIDHLDLTVPLLSRLLACAIFTIVPTCAVYRRVHAATPKAISATHVTGPEPLRGAAGHSYLADKWRARSDSPGIALAPGLVMPRHVETEGLALAGPPGSGKSVLMEGFVHQAHGRKDRLFLLDVKGGLAERMRGSAPCVLSLRGRGRTVWAVGRDIRDRMDALEVATVFIPESRDPVWSAGSRLILTGVMLALIARFGDKWGWTQLRDMLALPVPRLEKIVKKRMPEVAALLQSREDEPTAATLSLIMNLLAHVSGLIGELARAETKARRRLSITDWVRGQGTRNPIVVQLDLRYREQSGAYATLLLRLLGASLLGPDLKDGIDHKIWVFLDELPRIGRAGIVPVAELASLGRSRGIRTVISYQSPKQLTELIGEDGATALRENFGLQVICGSAAGSNAKVIAEDWIGLRTVSWVDYSQAKDGKTETKDIRALPQEEIIGGLGLRYGLWGRPFVRAAILGHENIPILDWPLHKWVRLKG